MCICWPRYWYQDFYNILSSYILFSYLLSIIHVSTFYAASLFWNQRCRLDCFNLKYSEMQLKNQCKGIYKLLFFNFRL